MTTAPQSTEALPENPLARHFSPLSLLRFAFPTIFMMVFYGLYTIVDTIFVSRFVNTDALSSINIVTPVINIIVGLGTMLAAGGSAIIARKLGEGREAEARSDLTLIALASFITGIFVAVLGLLFLEPLIVWLGASTIILPYAQDYLSILLLFTPINMLQVLFAVFFITAGRPGLGMAAGVLGGLINAILDYVFIVVLDMGIAGAALATGSGFMMPVVIGMMLMLSKRNILFFAKPRLDWNVLGESCYNGSSEMVSQLSAAVTTFFFNAAMMKLHAENGVAAITIIIYSQFLLTTLYIGFSMGVAPIISFTFGNQDRLQLKQLFRICYVIIAATSLVVFVIASFCGTSLIQLFSPQGTAVFALTNSGFYIFLYSFLLCGFNIFTSAFFTALSNGLLSAIISFSRTFVFIMVGLSILPAMFGVTGVWITVPLAEVLTFAISILFLLRNRDRYGY